MQAYFGRKQSIVINVSKSQQNVWEEKRLRGDREQQRGKKPIGILNEDWHICEDMTDAGIFL